MEHDLREDDFGPANALAAVKAFDAFPKTKPSYKTQSSSGGVWTVLLVLLSVWLASSELYRWSKGETTHAFSVEPGIGHDLQLNIDLVVAMKCDDLHVNIQDASGDRILAKTALSMNPTSWKAWDDVMAHALPEHKQERLDIVGHSGSHKREYQEEDVHDYLSAISRRKRFRKAPKVPKGQEEDSCRIFGSLHTNKVMGDLHITARGHGYMEYGQHLPHTAFNFTHHVNEFSFGPFYPSLENPLDDTVTITKQHFFKYQYFLSVVPTVYTTDMKALRRIGKRYESPSSGSDGLDHHPLRYNKHTVFTNQYAVTEQSHIVSEYAVPGIFIKYDIEPIMLTIAEEWSSFASVFIRIINVVSGILVAGGWLYQLSEWAKEARARGGKHGYQGAVISSFRADKMERGGDEGPYTGQINGYANGIAIHQNASPGGQFYSPMDAKNDPYSPLNARVPMITRPQKERAE